MQAFDSFVTILFIITLIYVAKAEMIKTYITLLAFQGLLLFGLAYSELEAGSSTLQLLFVLLETLIFKAIFVPLFLSRIVKSHGHRNNSGPIKGYFSILVAVVIIIMSFLSAHLIHDQMLQVKYFTAAISSILIGLFIAINNKAIVTHLVSYLVIENGIFLLSLAIGEDMPMFINAAILLDIFSSILIMGIFFNKMKDYYTNSETSQLTNLKD